MSLTILTVKKMEDNDRTISPLFGRWRTKRKNPYRRQDRSKKKQKKKVITLCDSDSEVTIIDFSTRNNKTVMEEITIDDEDIQVLEKNLKTLRQEAGVKGNI